MIGNLCCLLLGMLAGGLLVVRWWMRVQKNPAWLGVMIANALRSAAAQCNRSCLHFCDVDGAPVMLSVSEVSRTLEFELETWITQAALPRSCQLPPDGFA
jgi:hypothetical protein